MMPTMLVLATLGTTALIGWSALRQLHLQRRLAVMAYVRQYLRRGRHGQLPHQLLIQVSNDRSWPVLVSYLGDCGVIRHRLQFSCGGSRSAYALLSRTQD